MAAKETKLKHEFSGLKAPTEDSLRVRPAFPTRRAPVGPEPAHSCAGGFSFCLFLWFLLTF